MGSIIILFLCLNFETSLGFMLSYYLVPIGNYFYTEMEILRVVPKGFNLTFSYGKEDVFMRVNTGFMKGGWKDYFYSPYLDSSISWTDFTEINEEITILLYLYSKKVDIYAGFGFLYSYLKYKFKKIKKTESVEINYSGNLLGFPLVLGIEKRFFKKFKFYGEFYPLFYGLLKLKWKEQDRDIEKDYLISGGWFPFYLYEEGKRGRISFGVKYEW